MVYCIHGRGATKPLSRVWYIYICVIARQNVVLIEIYIYIYMAQIHRYTEIYIHSNIKC